MTTVVAPILCASKYICSTSVSFFPEIRGAASARKLQETLLRLGCSFGHYVHGVVAVALMTIVSSS